jgi:hypothetical protein
MKEEDNNIWIGVAYQPPVLVELKRCFREWEAYFVLILGLELIRKDRELPSMFTKTILEVVVD